MSLIIPSTQLFIVTSALNPNMGVLSRKERFQQTVEGLISLKEKCPDAVVLLVDGSPEKIEQEKVKDLSSLVNFFADFSNDTDIKQFAASGRKSEAENVLMLKAMYLLKQSPELMQLMHSVNRIYKFSARTILNSEFTPNEHNHFGKYVFKKRMPTWMSGERAEFFTDLLITRLFSFCPSLIDDYMLVCRRNIGVIRDAGVDTEHAHFFNIRPEYLIEIDKVHCQGVMASTGTTEFY